MSNNLGNVAGLVISSNPPLEADNVTEKRYLLWAKPVGQAFDLRMFNRTVGEWLPIDPTGIINDDITQPSVSQVLSKAKVLQLLGAAVSGIQIKLFGDPSQYSGGSGGDVRNYYGQYASEQFSLNANEVGLFYRATQNNDSDIYDGWEIRIFKKGKGTWGAGQGASPVVETDFILLYSTQYATSVPMGFRLSDEEYLGQKRANTDFIEQNFFLSEHINIDKYFNALHKAKANALDTMKLKFSWSTRQDDAAITPRFINSKRIGGNYTALSVTFADKDILKQHAENGNPIEYTLLIDRYRPSEWKGGTDRHRKSGFKHELNPHPDTGYDSGRISEIPIDNSTMILDFKQDFYFRDWKSGTFGDNAKFPAPMGASSKKHQTGAEGNSTKRIGWVDLGFRIRMSKQGSSLNYETPIIGTVRMIGVYETKDTTGQELRYITFSHK